MSLRSRLGRARNAISAQVLGVRSASTVDASTWNALEEALILADLGVSTTADVLTAVRQRADAEAINVDACRLICEDCFKSHSFLPIRFYSKLRARNE